MAGIIYGSLLIFAAFSLHLIIWQIRVPKRQTRAVIQCFLVVLVVGAFILRHYSSAISVFGLHPPIALRAYFSIGFYFISITLAYIITYSAIEADSPSLMIIMKIHEAGESGFKMESLEADLNNSSVILPRLKDLLIDKMAELEEGKYRLRAKGRLMAKLFSCYRNLMGAGKGG